MMYLFHDPPSHKTITQSLKQELYLKHGGKCMYCGHRPGIHLLEGDYKVPYSKGGTSKRSNYQLLCSACNKRKGNKTDKAFRRLFKAAGVPQVQQPPAKKIPQSTFEKVAKQIAAKNAKQAKGSKDQFDQFNPLSRQNNPFLRLW